jgi:short-subunit dehydrogenase
MESLAPVAQRLGIQVSLVEPGPVSSEFVSTTLDTSPTLSDALEKDYAIMLASYAESTKNAFAQLAQTPNDIAKILLEIATAEKAHFRYQTSAQGKKAAELKFVDTTGNTTIELVGSRLPAAIPC